MRPLIAISLIALALASCVGTLSTNPNQVTGSGNLTSEQRSVQGVHAVELATSGDLTITLGDSEALTIEAEDNLLPYLTSEVRGGVLTLAQQPGTNIQPTRPIHYNLTVVSLDSIEVSSSGSIQAPELRMEGDFAARISSSGSIRLAGLYAGNLLVDISSSGDLVIETGQVDQQDIHISSSGQYKGGDVRSRTVTARLSSSGDATVWVTERLDADLSSSGNVNYYGRPEITQNTSSSGRLVSLGDK